MGTECLNYTQVYTRVEGGIGGPNPPNGALGSPVKTSRNLFIKIKLQSSCMFLRLLLRGFVRAVVHKQFLEAGLKIQRFNKSKIRRFFTW